MNGPKAALIIAVATAGWLIITASLEFFEHDWVTGGICIVLALVNASSVAAIAKLLP